MKKSRLPSICGFLIGAFTSKLGSSQAKQGIPTVCNFEQVNCYLKCGLTGLRLRIIDACKGLIMYDTPAALFLLPHLILFAVRDGVLNAVFQSCILNCLIPIQLQFLRVHVGGEEAIAEIQTEISTVLQYAAIAVQKDVSGAATLEGKLELSTQAVFSTFDKLCRWLQDYGRDEGVEGINDSRIL